MAVVHNETNVFAAGLTASTVESTGPIVAANASVPAAPTAGAQSGTTPPAPVLTAGSTDTAGNITFGSGSGTPAIGDYVDVVFGTVQASVPRAVIIEPGNAATAAKQPCTVAKTATGFSIGLGVAAGVSQANTVYSVDYLVVV